MKATKLILLMSTMAFFSMQLSSQSIIRVGYNKYTYNSETYKFQEMEDVFISDLDSYLMYKSALKAKKTFRINGLITLGLIPVTTLALNSGDGNNIGFLISAVALSVTSTITWFSILISYPQRKNEAIRLFNNSQSIGDTYDPKLWDLKIGGGQYGYGVVLTF
ncbi:hypothetical protein N9L92_04885 [Saprospiraceae bacterium]|nr:hypothetical protein [Saprospiraceae bacterium]